MTSSAGRLRAARSVALRLSIASRAVTRGRMPKPSASLLDRLILALCALLVMFYAAMMPAKAADQLQHAPSFMVAHDHKDAADFSVNAVHDGFDDHAADHDDAPKSDDGPDAPVSGGHHHHGDSAPSLLVPDAVIAPAIAWLADLHGIDKDRKIAGLRSIGPERPPRTTSLNI